ncbi:DUF6481 family protein [Roseococcus sp. YIM B11640]|uniref:DUF6481 family protein n=1 Tax=Roseococcus sp. YIM B11640 TaxID=3133973 RepID=UPI003C7A426B
MATAPAWQDHHKDREKAANQARQKMLSRFSQRPRLDDPEVIQRLAEQKAAGELRRERKSQLQAEKLAKAQAEAAERIRLAAEMKERAAAEALAEETRVREEKAAAIALAEQQKAARDARYAARKARSR